MTDAQMGSYFDLMQDKASEPYFLDSEKNEFLNAAQIDFLNDLIGVNDPNVPIVFEIDERSLRLLQPLINPLTATTDSSGVLDLDSDFAALLRLGKGDGSEVKFVRFNDWDRINNNTYTAPSAGERAIYTYDISGLRVAPTSQNDWEADYVALPTAIDVAGAGTCDFPANAHYKIVALGLQKAGIPTEAEALALVNEVSN